MAGELGRLTGQIVLDVSQALSAYTEVRQKHLSTVSALGAGAGAVTALGAGLTAAGVGMGAALLDAAFAAGEFERKLDYFVAVGGPGAADQYDAVRQKALDLGNDTIYSADQIADSFIELAKSGVGVEDLLAGIGEAVSSLGAAADMPLEDAAKGLTTVLNTFGIKAADAVDVVDKLAGAANSSSIDVNDLILTLSYAGASAKTAGIEFDDINTAIALLGERGIRGSKAGTGLRQMFDKLIAPTKKGTGALKELGIVTEDGTNKLLDMDGGLKPIPELLDTLNGSLAGLTTAEKMDILGQIFPITSLPTILNLLDGGSEAMARLNSEIGKTTALDVATARLDNFSGDVEILRGNLETLRINIGSVQQGFLRWVTGGLVAVTQWLNTLDPEILSIVTSIAAAGAGFLAFLGITGLFAGAMLNIIQLIIQLKAALPVLGKIMKALTPVVRIFMLSFLPGPLGPILIALTAISAALAYFFTQTKTGQAVWAQLMGLFQQAAAAVMPLLQQLATVLSGWLASALQVIVPLLQTVGNVLMTVLAPFIPIITNMLMLLGAAFSGVGEGVGASMGGFSAFAEIGAQIVSGIISAIPIILTALVQIIIVIIQSIVSWAPMILTAAITVFLQLITALVNILPTLTTALITLVTQIITTLIGAMPMLIQGAMTLFTALITALVTLLPTIITALINLVLSLVASLITLVPVLIEAGLQLFMGLLEAIPVILPQLIDAAINLILAVVNGLISMLPVLLDAAIQIFMALVDAVIKIAPTLITQVINLIPTIISALIGLIPALLNGAIQLFTALVNALPKILPKLISAVIALIPKVISTLIGLIPTLLNAAVRLFMGIVQAIPKVLPQLINAVLTMGRQLIQGLANGVRNAGDAVMNAIGGVVKGAINWAKGLLGIKSPSRVFRTIGTQTIQGMIVGLAKQGPALARQMNMVASSLDDFYDQVYAAREFDTMLNLQADMGINASNGLASQLAALNEQLAGIAEKDTVNIEKLEVKKEEGEELDESLPKAIRKAAYMVG